MQAALSVHLDERLKHSSFDLISLLSGFVSTVYSAPCIYYPFYVIFILAHRVVSWPFGSIEQNRGTCKGDPLLKVTDRRRNSGGSDCTRRMWRSGARVNQMDDMMDREGCISISAPDDENVVGRVGQASWHLGQARYLGWSSGACRFRTRKDALGGIRP